jgi:Transposase, Mutator family
MLGNGHVGFGGRRRGNQRPKSRDGASPPTLLKGRTNVVALGITSDGVKIPLGLWEGSTENATVATALLSDLVDRGLVMLRYLLQEAPR